MSVDNRGAWVHCEPGAQWLSFFLFIFPGCIDGVLVAFSHVCAFHLTSSPCAKLCISTTRPTKVWRSSRYRNAQRYQNPRHIPREPSTYRISMDTTVILDATMHFYSYTRYMLLHLGKIQHWSSTCCDSYGFRSEDRLIV